MVFGDFMFLFHDASRGWISIYFSQSYEVVDGGSIHFGLYVSGSMSLKYVILGWEGLVLEKKLQS